MPGYGYFPVLTNPLVVWYAYARNHTGNVDRNASAPRATGYQRIYLHEATTLSNHLNSAGDFVAHPEGHFDIHDILQVFERESNFALRIVCGS